MARTPLYDDFYLGRGVDSKTGRVYAQAIEFDPPQAVVSGQRTELRLESITSSRELTEKLGVSASASVSALQWSASAEFKLTRSREINNYYTYALIRVVVENAPVTLRNPKLRAEARELLIQRGWDEFSASYGWEYVQGLITGGSYYALIEIHTESETQQQEITAKLSGSYGPFKADSGLETTLRDACKTTSMNIMVIQSGGNGDPLETDLTAMINQAINFPQMARNDPVTIAFTVADYRHTIPLPLALPTPNSLPRMRQKQTQEDLISQYMQLRDYKASCQFVLNHFSECDEMRELQSSVLEERRASYRSILQRVASELDRIVQLSDNCAQDYNLCQTYVRQFELLALPTIGGQLMSIKQMEEKLAALQEEVSNLRAAHEHDGQLLQKLQLDSNGVIRASADVAIEGSLSVAGEIAGKFGNGGHYTWKDGDSWQRMGRIEDGFPVIKCIRGNFHGPHQAAFVFIQNGWWWLGAESHGDGIVVEAFWVGTLR